MAILNANAIKKKTIFLEKWADSLMNEIIFEIVIVLGRL